MEIGSLSLPEEPRVSAAASLLPESVCVLHPSACRKKAETFPSAVHSPNDHFVAIGAEAIEEQLFTDNLYDNGHLFSDNSGGGRWRGWGYGGDSLFSDLPPYSPEDESVISTAKDPLTKPKMKPNESLTIHRPFPPLVPPLPPQPPAPPNELPVSRYFPYPEDCLAKTGLSDITDIDGYSYSPGSQLLPVPPTQPASSMASSSGNPCLSSLSSYTDVDYKFMDQMNMNYSPDSTSFFFPDPALLTPSWAASMGAPAPEWPGIFLGNLTAAQETGTPAREGVMNFQDGRCTGAAKEFGTFGHDWIFGDHQNLISCSEPPPPPPSNFATMEISSFKVPRLSAEERTAKINRYLKKRNMRNFGKKIKYACRKTLADSRPRVRGRFAKSDEFEETTGLRSGHHDDEDDDDVYSMSTQTQEFKVKIKQEESLRHHPKIRAMNCLKRTFNAHL